MVSAARLAGAAARLGKLRRPPPERSQCCGAAGRGATHCFAMKSEVNYHEQSHYYSTKFMRNSKAVGVLWGVFTVCYTVLIIVVFLQVSGKLTQLVNPPIKSDEAFNAQCYLT